MSLRSSIAGRELQRLQMQQIHSKSGRILVFVCIRPLCYLWLLYWYNCVMSLFYKTNDSMHHYWKKMIKKKYLLKIDRVWSYITPTGLIIIWSFFHCIVTYARFSPHCVCLSGTYNNQQNEVDEVVEGMCIHHIVHDLHPPLQSDHLRSKRKGGGKYTAAVANRSYQISW